MGRYAVFFKELAASEPGDRATKINAQMWLDLDELVQTHNFGLTLISLVNTCPSTVIKILKHENWLAALDKPWHWYDMYVALRAQSFPKDSCDRFVTFLEQKGSAAEDVLSRLLKNTTRTAMHL